MFEALNYVSLYWAFLCPWNLGFIDICVFVFSTACLSPVPASPPVFSLPLPALPCSSAPSPEPLATSRRTLQPAPHRLTSPRRPPLSFALSPFPFPLIFPFSPRGPVPHRTSHTFASPLRQLSPLESTPSKLTYIYLFIYFPTVFAPVMYFFPAPFQVAWRSMSGL